MTISEREKLAFVNGKLSGLAGTTKYDMPAELRAELRELADELMPLWAEAPATAPPG